MHYNYDSFARTEMDGKFIKRVIIITRFVRKEDVFESEFKKEEITYIGTQSEWNYDNFNSSRSDNLSTFERRYRNYYFCALSVENQWNFNLEESVLRERKLIKTINFNRSRRRNGSSLCTIGV